jgi:hypothetical protein
MTRRRRDEVVTDYEHELVGERVIGNFGDGEIKGIRWCAMWEGKQAGIAYDDRDLMEIGSDCTELVWEDLDDVEFLGDVEFEE